MEINLLPFLKGFCYFYQLQLPQDLTMQGTVQTWSRFLLEKSTLKQAAKGSVKRGKLRHRKGGQMSKKKSSAKSWHLDSRAPKNHLRTKNMSASFLCQADKARMRKPAADFPCPWDLLGHCSVCQFGAKDMKDQTTGKSSPAPVWGLEAHQANSPGALHRGNGGCFFARWGGCQTIPQQGSLLDQDSPFSGDVLIFCLWSWDHLGMPSPGIIFPTSFFPMLLV